MLSLHPKEEMRQAVSAMAGIPIDKHAVAEFENGMQILLSPGLQIALPQQIRRLHPQHLRHGMNHPQGGVPLPPLDPPDVADVQAAFVGQIFAVWSHCAL